MSSKEIKMEVKKCAICGKPAKYISFKFLSPLCEDCAKEQAQKLGAERGYAHTELEDFYTEPCEEMNDIIKMVGVSTSQG